MLRRALKFPGIEGSQWNHEHFHTLFCEGFDASIPIRRIVKLSNEALLHQYNTRKLAAASKRRDRCRWFESFGHASAN